MMLRQINEDIAVALEKDPAARNALEVLFLYPGVHALIAYRVTHLLWGMGLKFIACLLYTSPSPRDRTRSRMPSSA